LATKSIDTDAILAFWFEDCCDQPESISQAKQRWYRGGAALDRHIQAQFKTAHASAATEAWVDALTDRAILARIILLDQFSRHLYCGTPKAFAFDSKALNLSHRLRVANRASELHPIEHLFALHPYHHAENRAAQRLGIAALDALIRHVPPVWKPVFQRFLKSFEEHALIIERFGRFPHRNQSLNRHNTVEETQYLAQQHQRYGQ